MIAKAFKICQGYLLSLDKLNKTRAI